MACLPVTGFSFSINIFSCSSLRFYIIFRKFEKFRHLSVKCRAKGRLVNKILLARNEHAIDIFTSEDMENILLCIFRYLTAYYIINSYTGTCTHPSSSGANRHPAYIVQGGPCIVLLELWPETRRWSQNKVLNKTLVPFDIHQCGTTLVATILYNYSLKWTWIVQGWRIRVSVNILAPFINTEVNNCFSIYFLLLFGTAASFN